jgi:hypothetical protein
LRRANADPIVAIFESSDTDDVKGELSLAEFTALEKSTAPDLTDDKIGELYQKADIDSSGSVSL